MPSVVLKSTVGIALVGPAIVGYLLLGPDWQFAIVGSRLFDCDCRTMKILPKRSLIQTLLAMEARLENIENWQAVN